MLFSKCLRLIRQSPKKVILPTRLFVDIVYLFTRHAAKQINNINKYQQINIWKYSFFKRLAIVS